MREFTLIHGCMFAGKTTKLIELYHESELFGEEKLAVKPMIDNRYNATKINTHSGLQMSAYRINKAEELYTLVNENTRELFIDEVQFLGPFVIEVIGELMMNQVRIVAAGLERDYMNRDFGPMNALKKLATHRIEVTAKCDVCGERATYTYRHPGNDGLILIGSTDLYQARCEKHWNEGMLGRN